jgi:hypothetical protein
MHLASAAPVSLSALLSSAAAAAAAAGVGGEGGGSGVPAAVAAAAGGQTTQQQQAGVSEAVSAEVSGAVRRGACMLFGVLRPAEVQGVHQVLSQGPLGGMRREALAGLRAEFEQQHKHGGKV